MYPWREELTMTAYRNECRQQAGHYQLVKEARRFSIHQQKSLCILLIRIGEAMVNLGRHLENRANPIPAHAK